MTKCIVIGENLQQKQLPKRIEFCLFLDGQEFDTVTTRPKEWEYIELISHNGEFDVRWVYDNPENRDDGTLYLGHWNDGVI